MAYSLEIGTRYLRSKKRSTISVITIIAVTGVALGVAALLAVLSITSGFQREFRDKVLGVNAHVLVLKYGVDFEEYRDVLERARRMPEVSGADPFLINEMMLAKGDRLSGVLVKGVDPVAMLEVLDLPSQIIQGSLDGLRREGAMPPVRPEDLAGSEHADWDWLADVAAGDSGAQTDAGVPDAGDQALEGVDLERLRQQLAEGNDDILLPDGGIAPAIRRTPIWGESPPREAAVIDAGAPEMLPQVHVASPAEVEAALANEEALQDLTPEQEAQIIADDQEIERQAREGTAELPGIVVGKTLAQSLGLGIGDRVSLISPTSGLDVSMFTQQEDRAAQSRDFRVIGVFEAGFQEYDSGLVYVDLFEAERFYNRGDSVTGVELRLHDLDQSREVARKLERELGGPFHTVDWAELNRNLFTALEIQKVILTLVIATIIFVAAFNVVATLIMIVLEKKREIAILKAMGATDTTILGIFMVQGSVVGLLGTAIGLLVGGGIVWWLSADQFPLDPKVYLIDHLPVVVSPVEFALTAVIALVICTFATLAPSFWAARMLPVEGLRHD
ncbi:MAG: ABC transporter permease [Deltaproteobacteria bacterium]|nr:ABC transporter permease [Deltaproteobacteria bacterium]